jgi:hypothetical protein
MDKVDLEIIIDEKDFAAAKRSDPGSYQQGVEVVAAGKTYTARAVHPKGGGFVKCDDKTCGVYMEELRNTDEELVEKFCNNVAGLFSLNKATSLAHHLLQLDTVANVADFMETLAPS